MSPGWVKNTRRGNVPPAASKCIQVFTVPQGLSDWQDRADKGKLRQRRLADKEIRQCRVSWWMNVGRKMNGLIDRSLNTANKDRWRERWSMKRKCLSWHPSAVWGCPQLSWWIDGKIQTHASMVCGEFIFTMLLNAHVCLSFLPLYCTLPTQQVAAVRNKQKNVARSIFHPLMPQKKLFLITYSAFIPTVNNAYQFASIIHWISLAILSVFFAEVSLCLSLAVSLTADAAACRLMPCCAVCGASSLEY